MIAPDREVLALIEAERRFQRTNLNLTAAANYLTPGVRAAMDPCLQDILSEGYPEQRYHQGQDVANAIEELAVARAKRLFGAEHANVQPLRGTIANLAAAMAVMEPGDALMGMEVRSGGHYSTGGDVHVLGRLFRVVPYPVSAGTLRIDYDAVRELALRERPKALFCGDTAYARLWDYERMARIAHEAGAVMIADISQVIGLVAGGAIPSPVPHADIVTSATYKTLRGPHGGLILCRRRYQAAVDRAVYPVCQGGPNLMTLAGLAAALEEAASDGFRAYAGQVVRNTGTIASELVARGFDLVTGGSDHHACLVDLRGRRVRGDVAAGRLARARLICNGNLVPFDPGSPRHPSGLRLGPAAVTSLGMGEAEMVAIAALLHEAFEHLDDDRALAEVGERALALRQRFQPDEEER